MKYELLIFDADDTLFDFKKAEEYALINSMKDLEVECDVEYHIPLYRKMNIAIWKEFERGEITQKKLKVERFRRFLEVIHNLKDPKLFSESFMNHLANASFLFEGAEDLIDELSNKYRLVMVTNGLTRVQKIRVCQSVIAHYFEKIIISEEIGYAKPNPMIFEKGLEDVSLPSKDKIVIIGDSLTSDIPGGINYGIDTILFNPEERDYNSPYTPTYEVHSFNSLLNLL